MNADFIYMPIMIAIHWMYIKAGHKINEIACRLGIGPPIVYFVGPTILGIIVGILTFWLYNVGFEPIPAVNIGFFLAEYLIHDLFQLNSKIIICIIFIISTIVLLITLLMILYRFKNLNKVV